MNKQLTKAFLLAGIAVSAIAVQALPAKAVQFFNDRADWEAALGASVLTESFDSGVKGAQTSLDFGGLAVQSNDDSTFKVEGQRFKVRTTQSGIKFLFDSPVNGFFADWSGVGQRAQISGDFDGTGEQQFSLWEQLPGNRNRSGSFGIIGDAAFTEFELFSNVNAAENLDIDNFSYEAVPEPTTALAIVSVGAIAAGGALKRKKQMA